MKSNEELKQHYCTPECFVTQIYYEASILTGSGLVNNGAEDYYPEDDSDNWF